MERRQLSLVTGESDYSPLFPTRQICWGRLFGCVTSGFSIGVWSWLSRLWSNWYHRTLTAIRLSLSAISQVYAIMFPYICSRSGVPVVQSQQKPSVWDTRVTALLQMSLMLQYIVHIWFLKVIFCCCFYCDPNNDIKNRYSLKLQGLVLE